MSERIHFILDKLKEGLSTREIDKLIQERKKTGRRIQKKGVRSEARAKELLESLDIVSEVRETSTSQDAAGMDLFVIFNTGVKKVKLQIKSSQRGVDSFVRDKKADNHTRMIVLNCGKGVSDDEIIENFISELEGIDKDK